VNNTDQTWTFGVYQTIPDMSVNKLENVSWLQSSVPKGGNSGVSFQVNYNVLVANYVQSGGKGVYKASQTLSANLGTNWDVVYQEGVQQLVMGSGPPPPADSIFISNKSGLQASPGIGMSGRGSVYKNNIYSGSQALFQVTPTYYVAVFNSIVLGQVISSAVSVGDPIPIVFNAPSNIATATLDLVGNTLKLKVTYSAGFQTNLPFSVPHITSNVHIHEEGVKNQSNVVALVNSAQFHKIAAQEGILILGNALDTGHGVSFSVATADKRDVYEIINKISAEEGTKLVVKSTHS